MGSGAVGTEARGTPFFSSAFAAPDIETSSEAKSGNSRSPDADCMANVEIEARLLLVTQ